MSTGCGVMCVLCLLSGRSPQILELSCQSQDLKVPTQFGWTGKEILYPKDHILGEGRAAKCTVCVSQDITLEYHEYFVYSLGKSWSHYF